MKFLMNYYKDRHFDIDILFVNTTLIVLMLSLYNRFVYLKMLLLNITNTY